MKRYHAWLASFVLGSFAWMHAANASSGHGIFIYGPEQGIQLNEQSNLTQDTHYTLNLGAFKNKQNALKHQARMQERTKKIVHLTYQPEKDVPYIVFMGPFTDTQSVVAASRALLEKQPSTTVLSNHPIPTPILPKEHVKQPLVMVSGGPGWSSPGKTQTLMLESNGPNTYRNHAKTQTLGMGEVFLGLQRKMFVLNPISFQETLSTLPIQTQWGVLVSAAGMARIKGDVWQLADPEFNNMSYSYNINQIRAGLRTKWLLDQYAFTEQFKPYMTASLAAGFNHAFSFQNSPKSSDIVANPNFKDKTVVALSYSVGAGIQKEINPHTHIGLGYEFFDWGKSGLTSAPGQETNAAPFLNHLYAQTLLLSLTYLK